MNLKNIRFQQAFFALGKANKFVLLSLIENVLFLSCLAVAISCRVSDKSDHDLRLWYTQPARIWEEALPLGNGTTGAMVWGGALKDQFSLNDRTLWSGGPKAGNVKDGPAILQKVRTAIDAEDYGLAGQLWKGMHGHYSARYLPMGDLFLEFDFADSSVSGYTRELDLRKALSTVKFMKDGISHTREAFISYPDKAMVIHLSASRKQNISFDALLSSKLNSRVEVISPVHLRLSGRAPVHVAHRDYEPEQVVYDVPGGKGMNFEIDLKIIANGGELISADDKIGVRQADEVVLILTGATSFNGFDKSPGLEGKDPSVESMKNLELASSLSWHELLKKHLADYGNLFERVELELGNGNAALSTGNAALSTGNAALSTGNAALSTGDTALSTGDTALSTGDAALSTGDAALPTGDAALPTDERMLKYNTGNDDNGLVALYFQYGRYLMIASSRDGSNPTNLQGIWNPHVQPPWGSNYTVNINTEMNYWPAEITNLSECHTPLLNFLEHLAVNGAVTAKTNYGISKGWTVHHNSDIWAKTSPTGGENWDHKGAPRWSCWPMAGAWFCQHLWEHYLFTGDKDFLEKQAWPLMKGAAEFMLEWLVMDENGYWATNPSSSPENVFTIDGKSFEIAKASAMDMSIIRELFAYCIEAAGILGIDDGFTTRTRNVFPKLYPFHIGRHGQLQEWFKDWDDPKDTHRHLSHLFSLYPGSHITPETTPELAKAAKQSLLHRGDVSTGWSMAWKVNWWARLKDGNHALKILNDGLTYIGPEKETKGGGGTYPNLFDAHPPFQIDGNFGGTAGVAEMLVQSHQGYIHLLPALPDEWPEGRVSGLVARGGFVIDMSWKEGKVHEARIMSRLGGVCRVKANGQIVAKGFGLNDAPGASVNPLLKEAAMVPFINNAKNDPVELVVPEGKMYEWETVAGKEYVLKKN